MASNQSSLQRPDHRVLGRQDPVGAGVRRRPLNLYDPSTNTVYRAPWVAPGKVSDTPQSTLALSEVQYLLNQSPSRVKINPKVVLDGKSAIELTSDRGRFNYWIASSTYQPLQSEDRQDSLPNGQGGVGSPATRSCACSPGPRRRPACCRCRPASWRQGRSQQHRLRGGPPTAYSLREAALCCRGWRSPLSAGHHATESTIRQECWSHKDSALSQSGLAPFEVPASEAMRQCGSAAGSRLRIAHLDYRLTISFSTRSPPSG